MAGGAVIQAGVPVGGHLTGRALIVPITLITSLFFLWGFSYGLLDVLNKHFQNVLGITKLESTGLQVVYFGGGYLLFSPIAAEVLRRKSYKITILMGLALYSLGAILFWPVAHAADAAKDAGARHSIFGGFCACTLVIACGLATLETAANSYAVVIGNPHTASARLQFCQSFNGVASFIGPLIASKFFFSGEGSSSLSSVQFVYLGVSCAGVAVAIVFLFYRLPEVAEASLEAEAAATTNGNDDVEAGEEVHGSGPLYKQYNMIFAFLAQLCYVGAQVTIASFFINYATENASFTDAQASNMLSYALITFTVGRFVATALATVFQADFLLLVYVVCALALNAYACAGHGKAAVGGVIAIFFFEAPMYPTLFTLGTANLGRHTRRGAGILVMGVCGGAIFPPIQGAIADSAGTRISYVVPLVGFVYVLGYVLCHWLRTGRHIMREKDTVVAALPSPSTASDVDIKIDEKKAAGSTWVERA